MKKWIVLLITVLSILALPVAAKGVYWLLPNPAPEHFARMFEKQILPEKFHGAVFDETGSYWPECINMPGYGVPIFANHGPPCVDMEIGFINAPMRSSPMHWRVEQNPDGSKYEFLGSQDEARVIIFLKANGMHYAGENRVDFKHGVRG